MVTSSVESAPRAARSSVTSPGSPSAGTKRLMSPPASGANRSRKSVLEMWIPCGVGSASAPAPVTRVRSPPSVSVRTSMRPGASLPAAASRSVAGGAAGARSEAVSVSSASETVRVTRSAEIASARPPTTSTESRPAGRTRSVALTRRTPIRSSVKSGGGPGFFAPGSPFSGSVADAFAPATTSSRTRFEGPISSLT